MEREAQNSSCTHVAVWWRSPTYDDELLDLWGPKVYKPLYHKLGRGVYYDIASKCV